MPDGEYLEIDGGRLWYLDSGGPGVPVVFLHANTGTSESWVHQLGAFADAGYRSIAFDRRGWGRSEATGRGDPGTVAGDLDQLVEALGLARFHIVSIAGGAFQAIDYVAWRPTRVRSLVLAATMGLVAEDEVREFFDRIRIEAIADEAYDLYREVSAGYRGHAPEGAEAWRAIAAAAHRPGAPVQGLRSPNTYAKLETIAAPTLVIAGGADLIAPPAVVRLWASHVAGAELVLFPEAGHAIAWEEPETFNATVLRFFADNP